MSILQDVSVYRPSSVKREMPLFHSNEHIQVQLPISRLIDCNSVGPKLFHVSKMCVRPFELEKMEKSVFV